MTDLNNTGLKVIEVEGVRGGQYGTGRSRGVRGDKYPAPSLIIFLYLI